MWFAKRPTAHPSGRPQCPPTPSTHAVRRALTFNGLCLLSLLACAGTAWLWWRSVRVADVAENLELTADGAATRFAQLRSERGTLTFSFGHSRSLAPAPPPRPIGMRMSRQPLGIVDAAAVRQTLTQGWLGVRVFNVGYTIPRRPPIQYRVTRRGVRLPDGVLVVLLAIPPARWVRVARRRRRRARLGLCLRCGYDLRATPGRCPECGAVPKPRIA